MFSYRSVLYSTDLPYGEKTRLTYFLDEEVTANLPVLFAVARRKLGNLFKPRKKFRYWHGLLQGCYISVILVIDKSTIDDQEDGTNILTKNLVSRI